MKHSKDTNEFKPFKSEDMQRVRFHAKSHGVWYKGIEVDMLLDQLVRTLKWHEDREASLENEIAHLHEQLGGTSDGNEWTMSRDSPASGIRGSR